VSDEPRKPGDPDTDAALTPLFAQQRALLQLGRGEKGFDPELEASVIGREVKSYDVKGKGRWLRAQIDKAHEYAAEIKQLVEKGLVGLSSGAVDHLTVIAADGAIKRWPWVEWSLTPIPANPEAIAYSVKSADALAHLAVLGVAAPDAIKEVEAPAEPDPVPDPEPEPEPEPAVKEGRRNSMADQGHVQSAHDSMVAMGAKCSPDNMPEGEMPSEPATASTKDATAEPVPEPAATPLIGIKASEPVPNVDLDAIAVAVKEQLAPFAHKVIADLLRT